MKEDFKILDMLNYIQIIQASSALLHLINGCETVETIIKEVEPDIVDVVLYYFDKYKNSESIQSFMDYIHKRVDEETAESRIPNEKIKQILSEL